MTHLLRLTNKDTFSHGLNTDQTRIRINWRVFIRVSQLCSSIRGQRPNISNTLDAIQTAEYNDPVGFRVVWPEKF